MSVTIYHNPRCSKSRQTLQLLRDRGIEPKVIEYLHDPPDPRTLEKLAKMLKLRPIEMVRRGESPFKSLALDRKQHDDAIILEAISNHPILLERPIVVHGQKAALGRPPQSVLEIL